MTDSISPVASVRTEIPWDVGGTSTVDFRWVTISDRFVFGDDGPP